ncbi:hypothetical protein ACTZWW_00395 [Salinarimonas sp. NSM]|uniref:hypothetical protein n=1 Tax=Salinarimonas sp. NSM TaxID=3458003 RepID=UPI0040351976
MHNETLTRGSQCRALVPLEAPAAAPCAAAGRPDAGFLTQLIACERRLPAYRERRRAEPADGAARYGAVGATGARAGWSRNL